jgi:hypothetical protein
MRRALAVLALVARDKRRGSTARSAGPAALGSSPPPRLEEGVMRSLAPNPFAETSANGRLFARKPDLHWKRRDFPFRSN